MPQNKVFPCRYHVAAAEWKAWSPPEGEYVFGHPKSFSGPDGGLIEVYTTNVAPAAAPEPAPEP